MELTGTITGATWKGERTISFEFDESGATGSTTEEPTPSEPSSGGNTVTGNIPAVNTLYQGCFVLSVTNDGDNSAEVVLVSPNEVAVGKSRSQIENLDEYINSKLSEADVEAFSDWRLPTLAELNQLHTVYTTANNLFNNNNTLADSKYYLCTLEDVVIMHKFNSTSGTTNQTNFSATDLIRPFVTIHITEE